MRWALAAMLALSLVAGCSGTDHELGPAPPGHEWYYNAGLFQQGQVDEFSSDPTRPGYICAKYKNKCDGSGGYECLEWVEMTPANLPVFPELLHDLCQ